MICYKCYRGFMTTTRSDNCEFTFCSNALCDVNFRNSYFVNLKSRELVK